ncbi:UPF0114 protein in repA1-repA2 intergenic region, partial [Aphis craccivora]
MEAERILDNKIMLCVIIHLTFVLSAFGMAYIDKMIADLKFVLIWCLEKIIYFLILLKMIKKDLILLIMQ